MIARDTFASAFTGIWFLALSSAAQAQAVRTSADVTVGASYGTNPFLRQGDSGDGGSLYIQIDPDFVIEDETTTVALTGLIRLGYYTDRYGLDETARIGLVTDTRLSEQLRFASSASFQTSRSAAQDILFGVPSVLSSDGMLPELPVIDPTVAGLRTRTSSAQAGVDLEYQLSPISVIGGGLNSQYRFYAGASGSDYGQTDAAISYSRRMSETFTLTGNVEAGVIDYSDRGRGDAVVLTPTIGVEWRLSETGKLSAQVGISYARIDVGLGQNNSKVYAAGKLSYCDRMASGSLCLSANRSARPTGFAGASAVSAAALGYSRELNEFEDVSISLRYGRTDQSRNNGFVQDGWRSEYGGIAATYRRKIDDRLYAFATPTISKVYSDAAGGSSNFGILAGMTMTFGDQR